MNNATLQRIDTPGVPTAGGDTGYAQSSVMSVRCVLDAPSTDVRRLIAEQELKSTAVLFVRCRDLPTAPAVLLANSRVLVLLDGGTPQLMTIDMADNRSKASISHVQCLVRAA